jgi:hypothetical protein
MTAKAKSMVISNLWSPTNFSFSLAGPRCGNDRSVTTCVSKSGGDFNAQDQSKVEDAPRTRMFRLARSKHSRDLLCTRLCVRQRNIPTHFLIVMLHVQMTSLKLFKCHSCRNQVVNSCERYGRCEECRLRLEPTTRGLLLRNGDRTS